MASDVSIDDDLLNQAIALGPHGSKEATVREALQEYIARRKHESLSTLASTIEYRPDSAGKDTGKKP